MEESASGILDSYFGSSFQIMQEALENIESNYSNARLQDLVTQTDCHAFKTYLQSSGRLGLTGKLVDLMEKKREKQ